MVPRDGDGVELGHVLQGKKEIGVIILTGILGYIRHVLQGKGETRHNGLYTEYAGQFPVNLCIAWLFRQCWSH